MLRFAVNAWNVLAFWGITPSIVNPKVAGIVFRILLFATDNITLCGLDGTCKSPNVGITTAHLAVAVVLHEVAFHFRFLPALVTSGAGCALLVQLVVQVTAHFLHKFRLELQHLREDKNHKLLLGFAPFLSGHVWVLG